MTPCRACQHEHPLAEVCLTMVGGTPKRPMVCWCDK